MTLPEYEYKRPTPRRYFDRRCYVCGEDKVKDDLRAKRIQFTELGSSGRLVRSRTVAWLCIPCMEADPDYLREDTRAAPAFRGADAPKPKVCYIVRDARGVIVGAYPTLAVANTYWKYGWPAVEKSNVRDAKKEMEAES